jgi:hypothetical protein
MVGCGDDMKEFRSQGFQENAGEVYRMYNGDKNLKWRH